MPEGSGPELWRHLLDAALRVVDSVEATGYGRLVFRMGGGTVLALRFGHRISNDIDLFIDDAQALGFLTPRLNDTTARLTGSYQEQANTLKLVLPEGDIDFILAGPVTREPAQDVLDLGGRAIPLEPVAEILAKKIMYRAASFKPRDVFDLAVGLDREPEAAAVALAATKPVHQRLRRRLEDLRGMDSAALAADILVTAAGRPHLDQMVERVADAIERFA